MRSILSYRLMRKEATFGALDFYAKQPHAYSAFSTLIGQVFASHEGVAPEGAINEEGTPPTLHEVFTTRATKEVAADVSARPVPAFPVADSTKPRLLGTGSNDGPAGPQPA